MFLPKKPKSNNQKPEGDAVHPVLAYALSENLTTRGVAPEDAEGARASIRSSLNAFFCEKGPEVARYTAVLDDKALIAGGKAAAKALQAYDNTMLFPVAAAATMVPAGGVTGWLSSSFLAGAGTTALMGAAAVGLGLLAEKNLNAVKRNLLTQFSKTAGGETPSANAAVPMQAAPVTAAPALVA